MQIIKRHFLSIIVAAHLVGLTVIMSIALTEDGDRPHGTESPSRGDAFMRADVEGRVLTLRAPRTILQMHFVDRVGGRLTVFMSLDDDRGRERT
jgi:hypothetical protein